LKFYEVRDIFSRGFEKGKVGFRRGRWKKREALKPLPKASAPDRNTPRRKTSSPGHLRTKIYPGVFHAFYLHFLNIAIPDLGPAPVSGSVMIIEIKQGKES
jgi:hypothetical protein